MNELRKFTVLVILIIYFKFNVGQDECKTPGNKVGKCIQIENCHYLNELANKRPLPTNAAGFIRAHYCSVSDPSIVCCAVDAINKTPNTQSSTVDSQEKDSIAHIEDKLIESSNNPNGSEDTSTRFQFPSFTPFQFGFPSFNGFPSLIPNQFGAFGMPFNFFQRQQPQQQPQQHHQQQQQQPQQPYYPTQPTQYNQPIRQQPANSNNNFIPNINNNVNNQPQQQHLNNNNNNNGQGNGAVLPSPPNCGVEVVGNRILNGDDAEENEFPWVALLEYRRYDNSLVIACAGSLINEKYVLSAGHCVTGKILRNIGPLVNVRLGDWDVNINENCGAFCQRYNAVDEITPYPDYVDGNINHLHDIALIRLKRNAQITTAVRPICLPPPNSQISTGERMFAAGFGRTLEAAKSAIKQKIQLPIYDQSRCRTKFSPKRVDITNNHLCAGGELNRDTCDGDSGGPLMRFKNNWILEGITSFGDSRCGREDLPGVYTRVSNYIDWIKNTIRP
jgi:hypothetical protein